METFITFQHKKIRRKEVKKNQRIFAKKKSLSRTFYIIIIIILTKISINEVWFISNRLSALSDGYE